MAYCSTCGAELSVGARFCSVCGAAVSTVSTTAVATTAGDLDLVLIDTGTCPQAQVDDILLDLLGYSQLQTIEIMTSLPTQIACGLTETQALYLAQALTEYGMNVAVYRGTMPVDLGAKATTSVYQSDGSFLKGVLATLATLTVANRVSRFLRWERPVPQHAHFVPRYEPRRPVHVHRAVAPRPEPVPQPQPHHEPQPQANFTSRHSTVREARRGDGAGMGRKGSQRSSSRGSGGFGGQGGPGNQGGRGGAGGRGGQGGPDRRQGR